MASRVQLNTQTWLSKRQSVLRLAQSREGVVGVDFGFVYKDGIRQRQSGVRFHVREKLPLSELAGKEVLPTMAGVLRCDVVEARYELAGSPRDETTPLELGLSIGNVDRSSTGSLGFVVRDRLANRPALLSNWHVMCGSTVAKVGDRISQPGPAHLGSRPVRLVAHVERWIDLNSGFDAAIALVDPSIPWKQQIFEAGLAVKGVTGPALGMKLVKCGAVSGVTHAIVEGVHGLYQVDYSAYGDKSRWMDGMRLVQDPDHVDPEISLGGDSGAAWVEAGSGHAVGLHFAGEDGAGATAEYALAFAVHRVLDLLDLDLLEGQVGH